jgi:predicted nucleic acid-binding protein
VIAADTSAWIDYSKGLETLAATALQRSLEEGILVIPPLVLVELLGGPKLPSSADRFIRALPRMDLLPGYWERTATSRRSILKKGLKARLGDCLIAQSCIDQNCPLITSDTDFRHFVTLGLKIA